MSRKQQYPASRKRQRPVRSDRVDESDTAEFDTAELIERQRRHDVGD